MILEGQGKLLINTDLHGNAEDFVQLRARFDALIAQDPESHWVLLGDVVHAPNAQARKRSPELYDYDDGSWSICEGILEAQALYPGRVHYVLGNHDYAHVGGPRTSKFYGDEAEQLEEQLSQAQIEAMHALFCASSLAVVTSCGALLMHGAPALAWSSYDQIEQIQLPTAPKDSQSRMFINSFMTFYGQSDEACAEVLNRISRDTQLPLTLIVHGHDRDEDGYFVDGEYMICPCIFGAPRTQKRYLLLDLAERYESVHALREGEEILQLYP